MSRFLAVIGAVIASASITAASQGDSPIAFMLKDRGQGFTAPSVAPRGLTPDRAAVARIAETAARRHGVDVPTFLSLVWQESRFNARAVGPRTRWGHAYGPGQMLCGTARTLGEPVCGRLTRDPYRALDLAAIYFKQGYAATGSWAGAARYYHGGPNTRLHGPKTAAYAHAVTSRRLPRDDPIFGFAPARTWTARATMGQRIVVASGFQPFREVR